MRGWRALVFVAAIAAPAVGQDADAPAPIDMIETVNKVCIAAQGDQGQIEAKALDAGFSPVPQSMLPKLRGSEDATGFIRSNATDVAFVFTGTIKRRLSGKTVVMEFCGVGARPTDHKALDARLAQLMGFKPVKAGGVEAYAWIQTPEGRTPTRSLTDPEFLAMAETGEMRMVGLDRDGKGSMLLFFRPRVE
jgi:hypothetical protein